MSTVIAGLVIGISLSAFVVARYLAIATARLQDHKTHADEFFKAASKLAASPDTPPWALDIVDAMSYHLSQPRTPWHLVYILARPRPRTASDSQRAALFRRHQPALAELLGTAAVHMLIAASYLSPVAGWIVRRLVLFNPAQDKERAETLVERTLMKAPC